MASYVGKFTYAIVGVGTGRVKLGCADDVQSRGSDLQVGSPVELVLIATCDTNIEREAHRVLEQYWVHGEWFQLERPALNWIAARMNPASHSFASGLPTRMGRRHLRNADRRLPTDARDARRRGRDCFGHFAGSDLEWRELVRGLTFNERRKLVASACVCVETPPAASAGNLSLEGSTAPIEDPANSITATNSDLISYSAAARYLALKPSTLRVFVHRRQIPHIRMSPRLVMFDRRELDGWLASHTVAAEQIGPGPTRPEG